MDNIAGFTNTGILYSAAGLDLAATLFCGQSFAWRNNGDGTYTGVAGGRAATVWQQGEALHLLPLGPAQADDADYWRHYFALDEDYPGWLARFREHATLKACVDSCPGIRVLNQPFFDTLLSFIISQNNNIPRITGIVGRLRTGFGPQLAEGVYGFPSAPVLAGLSVEALAPLRAGFRAKYLLDAARRVALGEINEEALRALPTEEARKRLSQIYGVGQKVADCVLLFSLERKEVAPMDVWMKRAVEGHFEGALPECAAGGQGIAQQFIFYWARGQAGEK